jgi:multidrug efflux pump subunit AcrA (membrane-fusion protein)
MKNKYMVRSFLWFVLIAVLLLSASGCERIKEAYGKIQGDTTEAADTEAPIFAVNTTSAVSGPIQDYIPLSGDIVAGSTVDAYSDAAGKITRIYVAVGQWVNKGSPIADVDPSRPGMNYKIGTATSPVSGTIVALPAQLGMTITPATPLVRITGGSALELHLYVAERFISKMAMNLPCEITLDAWPGEVFRGSISEIAPTVEAASRTMEVKVNVNNTSSKIKAGMFAKVKVITATHNNIVKIPSEAVVNRFGEQYVFVVDRSDPGNPIARKQVIVPGIVIDGVMEVQSGLAANDDIVIKGQTLLSDGARINIIEHDTPLSAN